MKDGPQVKLIHRFLMLTPLVLSLIYVAIIPMRKGEDIFLMRSWEAYIELDILLVLLICLIYSFVSGSKQGQSLRWIALLLLCALTPAAIFSSWTFAPAVIDIAAGGYGFFLHWLTKYPNCGPINIHVLAGLLCVVLSSLIPAVFGVYATSKNPNPVIITSLMVIEIVCLLAVIIKLDFSMLCVGIQNLQPVFFTGPLLRLTGASAMFYISKDICQQIKQKD